MNHRIMPGVIFCCLTAFCAAAHGQKYLFEDGISITTACQLDGANEVYHGYIEHRLTITNSSNQARHVEVSAPERSFGGYRAEGGVDVPAHSGAVLSLYHPVGSMWSASSAVVRIDGRVQQDRMTVTSPNSPHWNAVSMVMFSRDVPPEMPMQLERVAASRPRLAHVASYDVRQWSDNWLAYTPFEALAVTPRDITNMPPGVWSAIRGWVECGGVLLVIQAADGPEYEPPREWRLISERAQDSAYAASLGECRVVNSYADSDWGWLHGYLNTRMPTLQKDGGRLNSEFDLVPNLQRTSTPILMVLIPIALIIGPVNLFMLARKNKRIWMLVTVPAFSFVACASLYGYALASEGLTPWGRTVEITVLDQRSRRASSIGWLAMYSPLTPRRGLTFATSSELTLQGVDMNHMGDRLVRCGDSQYLTSGWIQARIPMFLTHRRSQIRRERVEIIHSDGEVLAVNGLGTGIKSLHVAGPDGSVWSGADIPAGRQAKLVKVGPLSATTSHSLIISTDWRQKARSIVADPTRYLVENSYVAIMDAPVFLEQPVDNLRLDKSVCVVIGYLQEGSE
ncbi:MAG: hypothetical protein GXY38_00810 [Planctomycetes bacterium]|nr:hypothetical protein [Planctomycetota bacterium]